MSFEVVLGCGAWGGRQRVKVLKRCSKLRLVAGREPLSKKESHGTLTLIWNRVGRVGPVPPFNRSSSLIWSKSKLFPPDNLFAKFWGSIVLSRVCFQRKRRRKASKRGDICLLRNH